MAAINVQAYINSLFSPKQKSFEKTNDGNIALSNFLSADVICAVRDKNRVDISDIKGANPIDDHNMKGIQFALAGYTNGMKKEDANAILSEEGRKAIKELCRDLGASESQPKGAEQDRVKLLRAVIKNTGFGNVRFKDDNSTPATSRSSSVRSFDSEEKEAPGGLDWRKHLTGSIDPSSTLHSLSVPLLASPNDNFSERKIPTEGNEGRCL